MERYAKALLAFIRPQNWSGSFRKFVIFCAVLFVILLALDFSLLWKYHDIDGFTGTVILSFFISLFSTMVIVFIVGPFDVQWLTNETPGYIRFFSRSFVLFFSISFVTYTTFELRQISDCGRSIELIRRIRSELSTIDTLRNQVRENKLPFNFFDGKRGISSMTQGHPALLLRKHKINIQNNLKELDTTLPKNNKKWRLWARDIKKRKYLTVF